MLPESLAAEAEKLLQHYTGQAVTIQGANTASGGSINHSYVLDTTVGRYFLKYNSANRYPGMFPKEANALQTMAATQTIRVPQVIGNDTEGEWAFFVLEYLDPQRPGVDFWQNFAIQLGQMHQHTAAQYGWDEDNYMGSLQQFNAKGNNWVEFFRDQRLQVQIDLALSTHSLQTADVEAFEKLFVKLNDLLVTEPSALVHGDLWNGNFMVGPGGQACIFDPAAYYGNREVDLAMTRLFGGFDQAFYDAYHEAFPLVPGYEDRLDIYNLYPLLIHLNLFGAGYLGSIRSILKRYC